ncbi:MAG: hypothetical protein JAY75_09685 [Candidatus Thiodiazotropha taylori]|nr:hypothetical protein [Candidatus Thiodiazotropha taylori]MCG8076499.1 hypothetical protein [Candidatus Thiodiazotropha taylori]MCW4261725.1 hypothetical protein [Candidatus Thiodiazotropha endolucinida]
MLDAMERDPLRLLRIGWHVNREISFNRLDPIDFIDDDGQAMRIVTDACGANEGILNRRKRLNSMRLIRKRGS